MKRRYSITVTAWRDGTIHTLRAGARSGMALFRFTDWRAGLIASRIIQTNARHARHGNALLVPGVPEADSDDQALNALIAWHDRVAAQLGARLPAGSWQNLRKAA